VVRRDGVTLAISTSGDAPALTALLRESLDAVLPRDLAVWVNTARDQRTAWRREAVPMEARKPLLLRALNHLYKATAEKAEHAEEHLAALSARPASDRDPSVPWLSGPEDRGYDRTCLARRRRTGDPGLLTRKAIARLRAATRAV